MKLDSAELDTPIGQLILVMDGERLCAVGFGPDCSYLQRHLKQNYRGRGLRPLEGSSSVVADVRAYFAGDIAALDRIEVSPIGTDFQKAVWQALRRIPHGETVSYGELARQLGRPGASRAVGTANGSNPIPIVIPCHRVIASDGTLGGYGGGLDRKRWLLAHERALRPAPAEYVQQSLGLFGAGQ